MRSLDGPHIVAKKLTQDGFSGGERSLTMEYRTIDPIHYEAPRASGPIPRTMAELSAENVQLRQLLVTAWRSLQSRGGYLIQQGQGCESEAAMLARELQRLGVPLDVNALTMEG